MTQEKEYFAFISYQREDEKWAKWLADELEHYHLPTTLNGKDLPKSLRPIFRDVDELSAGNLPQQIYHALSISKNLSVVCSLRSAQSEWVNKEIEDYISIKGGKADDIYPFIVEGTAFSKDAASECFPEVLRQLPPNEERLGGNINEQGGRNAAVVKIIAGMLGIDFDSLWQKYEREKRKKRNTTIAMIVALAIVAIGVAAWMWHSNILLNEKNRKLAIENIRIGSREVLGLLEQGEFLKARHELESLLEVWDDNFRMEAPEFERALRAIYRYEHSDGIVRLYSIPIDKNQSLADADSSSLFVLDSNNKQQEFVLQYDINTGELKQTINLCKSEKDTVYILGVRNSYVVYRTSRNKSVNFFPMRLYNIKTGKDVLLTEGIGYGKIISDEMLALYNYDLHKKDVSAVIYSIRDDKLTKHRTLTIPFEPTKEAQIGDSLVFVSANCVVVWSMQRKQWIGDIDYTVNGIANGYDMFLSEVNVATRQFAQKNMQGLRVLSVDKKEVLTLDKTMLNGYAVFNSNGKMLAACDPYKDSLAIYYVPKMKQLYKIAVPKLEVTGVRFAGDDKLVITDSNNSKLHIFKIGMNIKTKPLYSPDASCYVKFTDDHLTCQLIEEATDSILFNLSDCTPSMRVGGFSPRGKYLEIGTDKKLYLLDYQSDSIDVVCLPDTAILPSKYANRFIKLMAFSNDENKICIVIPGSAFQNEPDCVLLYDLKTDSSKVCLLNEEIVQICMNENGSLLAVTDGRNLKVFHTESIEQGKPSKIIPAESGVSVLSVCFTPDSKSLLACYSDGSLKLWNIITGEAKSPTMRSPESSRFTHVDISSDGYYVLATSEVKTSLYEYMIWYVPTGEIVDHLTNEWAQYLTPKSYILPVYSAAFSTGNPEKIIINERDFLGLSRVVDFPAFEKLLIQYRPFSHK